MPFQKMDLLKNPEKVCELHRAKCWVETQNVLKISFQLPKAIAIASFSPVLVTERWMWHQAAGDKRESALLPLQLSRLASSLRLFSYTQMKWEGVKTPAMWWFSPRAAKRTQCPATAPWLLCFLYWTKQQPKVYEVLSNSAQQGSHSLDMKLF